MVSSGSASHRETFPSLSELCLKHTSGRLTHRSLPPVLLLLACLHQTENGFPAKYQPRKEENEKNPQPSRQNVLRRHGAARRLSAPTTEEAIKPEKERSRRTDAEERSRAASRSL
ncbi:hypothetical protein EYF80_057031 [Liparis tanakae]|uniref:Uncharacterized protein n=1 Tax=Liparis tanakae TaxID=230148 RepID=A0A4Z2EV90_9TELE|nr:hypothetical protein EYF80_057031 [Liparis tanakae]